MPLFTRNVLHDAFKVIPHEKIKLKRFKEIKTQDNGIDEIVYYDEETIEAIVEAIPSTVYKDRGLNLQKNYLYVHALVELKGLNTQAAADRLIIKKKNFDVYEVVDWFNYNGWSCVMAVEVNQ